MKLSVVIPAYNEEKDIRKAVKEVFKEFPSAEVVVVNDASTDKTLEILESIEHENLRIITNEKNRGHGFSVMTGLWHAKNDIVLYIDADRQIDISNFKKISEEQLYLYDVISGQRVHRNDKLFRKITSVMLRYTILLRHRYFIRDSNCPFKVYKRSVLRSLIPNVPDTLIIPIACLEVLARKQGFATASIPTPHKPYEGVREGFLQMPNKKFFIFCWKAFNEIIRI